MLIDREIPVATLFGACMYFAEQLGFRKILDCTFMVAAIASKTRMKTMSISFYRALERAQVDIDMNHQKYSHYYKREFPETVSRRDGYASLRTRRADRVRSVHERDVRRDSKMD